MPCARLHARMHASARAHARAHATLPAHHEAPPYRRPPGWGCTSRTRTPVQVAAQATAEHVASAIREEMARMSFAGHMFAIMVSGRALTQTAGGTVSERFPKLAADIAAQVRGRGGAVGGGWGGGVGVAWSLGCQARPGQGGGGG